MGSLGFPLAEPGKGLGAQLTAPPRLPVLALVPRCKAEHKVSPWGYHGNQLHRNTVTKLFSKMCDIEPKCFFIAAAPGSDSSERRQDAGVSAGWL